jgi:uncharacterized RDD family membrane protein YckC
MKCPKCGYLGFEPVDRCRNCGYDFSLTQDAGVSAAAPDLPMLRGTDPSFLDDLALGNTGSDSRQDRRPARGEVPADRFEAETRADLDRLFGKREADRTASPAGGSVLSAPEELPLFGGPITDDVPLITKPSPPRAPLAVRRATPEVPRLKTDTPRPPMLDLDPPPAERTAAARTFAARTGDGAADAPLGARFVAVVLDLMILAVVDVIVVYLTLQICGLTLHDAGVLPKGPLLAFLLVQNGGYLVAFTAGGQTLGKMAVGVRVVAADEDSVLDLGRAVVRELLWLVLAIPAGLGFLTTVFGPNHRGLHDRFAGTRVVRAS